ALDLRDHAVLLAHPDPRLAAPAVQERDDGAGEDIGSIERVRPLHLEALTLPLPERGHHGHSASGSRTSSASGNTSTSSACVRTGEEQATMARSAPIRRATSRARAIFRGLGARSVVTSTTTLRPSIVATKSASRSSRSRKKEHFAPTLLRCLNTQAS